MEILITHCLLGESSTQPQVDGLENDLMETMSHIKLEFSFPLRKKKKKKSGSKCRGPKPMASTRSHLQKGSAVLDDKFMVQLLTFLSSCALNKLFTASESNRSC